MTGKKPSENDTNIPPHTPPMSEDNRIDKKHKTNANLLNEQAQEIGGQDGPDATRYGDWEKGGRCTDF
ncbi:MAG: succinate dehydrogenase assembly factor 4 [Pseudomonadota bacterium]